MAPSTTRLAIAFRELPTPARYKMYYGGRGGAKSHAFALMAVVRCARETTRVLCLREFQNSIKDSAYSLIIEKIDDLGIRDFFRITDNEIEGKNGSLITFKGMARNIDSIRSTNGVDIAWVEEAQTVSYKSLESLIPTVRKEGSELWFSWNPRNATDPITVLAEQVKAEGKGIVRKVGWQDNPWFPSTLEEERVLKLRTSPEEYDHIWEGNFRTVSSALVFRGRFVVEDFDTPEDVERFHYGADWGFANDPTTLVRSWARKKHLYVDHEMFGYGQSIDALPALFDRVPGARSWPILCDNARPEFAKHLQVRGFRTTPADKWPQSVMDGVEYLKSFEMIHIHPRCEKVAQEFRQYSYKTNPQDERIVYGDLVDDWNHGIDAIRYSLAPLIRAKKTTPRFTRNAMNRLARMV